MNPSLTAKKMRKTVFILLAFLISSTSRIWAIPAQKGFLTSIQSDGTTLLIQALGDEFFHSLATDDGLIVVRNETGDYCYYTLDGPTQIIAHNKHERSLDEQRIVEEMGENIRFFDVQTTVMSQKIVAHVEQAIQASQVPNVGKVRVPIIVVEFADKKVSNPIDAFSNHYNQGANSARQYFIDQSNGKFEPQFDVFGVYELSENREAYGGNNLNGSDKGVAKMVAEACDLAKQNSDINWANYDNNGDGICDVVMVVFAGVGEAQAAATVPNAIWPCQWTLADAAAMGDGPGMKDYDGITVNKFAVFNEVQGRFDTNTVLDGIGTFCHEFSHCLGLPDFYMTTYGAEYGMGTWSLMDYGCYNNGGNTPVGYNAYEKSFFGWIELVTPQPDTEYRLPVFNGKTITSDWAMKVESPLNANEYYVIENRRRQGWDSYISDEGVMITHVTYVPARWKENSVNNYPVKLMTIMPADNVASRTTENADLFGKEYHEFTDDTNPAATLNLGANIEHNPSGNRGFLGKPITDIYLNDDGSATLRFCDKSGAKLAIDAKKLDFGNVYYDEESTQTITLKGENITSATTLSISCDDAHFKLSTNTLSADEVNGGVSVDVTFSPHQFCDLNSVLTITNPQRRTVEIPLKGRGVVKAYLPELKDVDASTITESGFKVEWTDRTLPVGIKNYSLRLTSDISPKHVNSYDFTALKTQANYKGELIDCLKKYSQFLPEGWTVTKALFIWDGHIVPFGPVTTTPMPTLGAKKISVVVHGQSLNEEEYTAATLTVKTSKESKTKKMTSTAKNYVYVLDCDSVEETIVLVPKDLPAIDSIAIYAGDVTFYTNSDDQSLEESTNESYQLIKNIVGNSYEVTGLKADTEYKYKIQAHYNDGTSSLWTDAKKVTTKPIYQQVNDLAGFLKDAKVGTPVAIADGALACVGVLGDGRTIVTKDNNGYADKDVLGDGEIDFVMDRTSFMRGRKWDQSNWILVELPEPISEDLQAEIVGRTLGGVAGTMADVDNPAITTSSVPTGAGEATFECNTYIAANFLGTQNGVNTKPDGSYYTYFFVKPKPNEIAGVHWAMWIEAEGCFKVPMSVGPINKEGLTGTFYADFSKYEGQVPELVDGEVYSFIGLITVDEGGERNSARRASANQNVGTRYMVYPLQEWQCEGAIRGNVITNGITDTYAGKQVANVEYVSVTGIRSSKPFHGANVVITTYTDGSRSVGKQVR